MLLAGVKGVRLRTGRASRRRVRGTPTCRKGFTAAARVPHRLRDVHDAQRDLLQQHPRVLEVAGVVARVDDDHDACRLGVPEEEARVARAVAGHQLHARDRLACLLPIRATRGGHIHGALPAGAAHLAIEYAQQPHDAELQLFYV